MSQEDADLVRRAFDGTGTTRLQDIAQTYWDPEVEYVEDPRWPGSSTYKGREAVVRCFENYLEALGEADDIAMTVEQVYDAGDRQVPFVRVRGRASASGLPHEHLWGYVVEVREGRITYFRAYYEPEAALAAVAAGRRDP